MSNEEVVHAVYEATSRRDWTAAVEGYDEHVVLIAAATSLEKGAYYGREALGRYFGGWLEAFDRGTHYDADTMVQGRDGLAVRVRERARGRESGIEFTNEFFCAYWFARGKIVRVEMHGSMEDAREAVGA